jgi:predicted ATPase
MLIKSLSLKDFKCFEQVDIDFGKITLLTGANSSGKSSLIYALLGIMQSKYFPQYFALNGELINMGGFDEVLRKKAEYKEFEIDVHIESSFIESSFIEDEYCTTWIEDESTQQPTLICLSQKDCILFRNEENKIIVDGYIYDDYAFEQIIKHNPDVICIDTTKDNESPYPTNKYHVRGFITEPSEIVAGYFDVHSLHDVNLSYLLSDDRYNFNYLGSFRLPPDRTYYRKPNASKVGVNGDGYIDQIIKWEESDKEKYDELIEAVTEMGLFKNIQANKMKGGRFELNVQVNENSELASLTDVGFGISQFLPIIVADLQMGDDSCLAISQPEIHLHPKIQATLGDYFCKQVNNTDKQYIVETHSEYLINRMRLLIVKGELKPEDVKLYYMENDGIKTTTYAIELTTDGQIKNAPQGFFDTYEMDVMDIALYASA